MASSYLTLTLALLFIIVQLTYVQCQLSREFVDAHNRERRRVRVPLVHWNTTLAAYARTYARRRINDCRLVPSGGSGGRYGENLFRGTNVNRNYTATDAVNAWMSERPNYSYERNRCQPRRTCRHYLQVVWRTSTSIGCERVRCRSRQTFIMCVYYRRGAIPGQRPW